MEEVLKIAKMIRSTSAVILNNSDTASSNALRIRAASETISVNRLARSGGQSSPAFGFTAVSPSRNVFFRRVVGCPDAELIGRPAFLKGGLGGHLNPPSYLLPSPVNLIRICC